MTLVVFQPIIMIIQGVKSCGLEYPWNKQECVMFLTFP